MKYIRKISGKLKILFLFLFISFFAFICCERDKSVNPEFEEDQGGQDPGGQIEKVIDIDEKTIF
jgi:hypothetical protein